MTGTNFAALIRLYTNTNSVTFPNSEIVTWANTVKDDFAPEIMKADEDLFKVIGTQNLKASSASDITTREYPLPDDNLKILSVEAKFDGTNWVKLTKLARAKYTYPVDETNIINQFSNIYPHAQYWVSRRSLWLFTAAISLVTSGLRMENIAYPADIAAGDLSGSTDLCVDPSTTTSQIPRQFHELWARRVSILWKGSKANPIPLTQQEQSFEKDFMKKISAITNIDTDEDDTGILPDDRALQY